MKRYTIFLVALALVTALLPGCRRKRNEPVTVPTTQPTTAATTAPTTEATTRPTTQPTEASTMPSGVDPSLPEGETGTADDNLPENARRIIPDRIR